MACISRALIVGGGIAGLSTAIALSREGVNCEIVEISGKTDGASLALSGRAAEALYDLGVYEQCCETGRAFNNDSTAASLHAADGTLIRPSPRRPEWPGAKDSVAVYRPDFVQILQQAAESNCTIRKGITIKSIEEGEKETQVIFSNGDSRAYDLVVGADGINSLTRKLIFPELPEPAYSGQLSIRWMVPGPAVEGEGWYTSPEGKVGFYYLPHQDLIYVPAVVSIPEHKRLSDLLDSISAPAIKQLQQRLTDESQLIGRPFNWILVAEPWHRGRTMLIGDAAHATTAHMGMGGGMALEDAVVLGQCVGTAASLPEAFDTFMSRRLERVKTVVESSVKLSELEQNNAPPSEGAALLTSAFTAISQPY
jgi:2-polyprenyl-6-methoxyphenol hydroxylase-like FAD-dependent oxidoreductase